MTNKALKDIQAYHDLRCAHDVLAEKINSIHFISSLSVEDNREAVRLFKVISTIIERAEKHGLDDVVAQTSKLVLMKEVLPLFNRISDSIENGEPFMNRLLVVDIVMKIETWIETLEKFEFDDVELIANDPLLAFIVAHKDERDVWRMKGFKNSNQARIYIMQTAGVGIDNLYKRY